MIKFSMKKTLLLLIHTLLFAAAPDANLLDYQKKYSVCKEKSNYKISQCLLNGNLNFSGFKGDRYSYRRISDSKIKKAARNGNSYHYTMSHLPKTKRYTGLIKYLDHLYAIKKQYVIPEFKGDEAEDLIRIKKNLQPAAICRIG